MRPLALLQIVFGPGIVFFSWVLASGKARTITHPVPSGDEIYLDFIPRDADYEFILLGLSLAVLVCGLLQWKSHIRAANLQIVFGLIMMVIYVFLCIRASIIMPLESSVYYLAYLSLTLGLAVFLIGFPQFIEAIKGRSSAK